MYRKVLAYFLVMAMMFSIAAAEIDFSNSTEYQGGVILRGYTRDGTADGSLIEVAYITCNQPYFVPGEATHWTMKFEGGAAPYDVILRLYHQEESDTSNIYWGVGTPLHLFDTDHFTYTFDMTGRYFWEVTIEDSNGQYLVFQTRPMIAAEASSESNALTVAGKVNEIVETTITNQMSDYTRALVLHDWLIENADYDYTYTHYDASGVLLYGAGVCDSYSRAYQMLCTAAGLECIYVTGYGNGGYHGWNLVKIDGQWYHVDTTWDDSGWTYADMHRYFLLTDDEMAIDHVWNLRDDASSDGMLVPETGEEKREEFSEFAWIDVDLIFATIDELDAGFKQFIDEFHLSHMQIGYSGNDSIWEDYSAWANEQRFDGGYISGWGISNGLLWLDICWQNPDDYLRIDASAFSLTLEESITITPNQIVPEDAKITWRSSNSNIAAVDAQGRVTAHQAGEAKIIATLDNGFTDSVNITVLPAYMPEFDLRIAKSDSGVNVSWTMIPGSTEYRVIRVHHGAESVLKSVSASSVYLTAKELPDDVYQEVYVQALRVVDGNVIVAFRSQRIPYGTFTVVPDTRIPEGIITIDESAFEGATQLTSISIPSSCCSVGTRAFWGCSALEWVAIPASVTHIGADAFAQSALTMVVVEQGSYADQHFATYYPNVTRIYQSIDQ